MPEAYCKSLGKLCLESLILYTFQIYEDHTTQETGMWCITLSGKF